MDDRQKYETLIEGLVSHGETLGRLVQKGNGAYHLESLLKVYDWAVAQQPFSVGDRVTVNAGPFGPDHGFSPWNAIWLTRPEAVVEAVEYNSYWEYWGFRVRLDEVPDKSFTFSARSLRAVDTQVSNDI